MKLPDLIATSYSPEIASAYKSFVPNQEQKDLLRDVGLDILKVLEKRPGACAMMSATYAARLRMQTDAPIFVVAGSPRAGGTTVFGSDKNFDGKEVFNNTNMDWDGHVWLMFGPYIADISLFRTAYSSKSPPALSHTYEKSSEMDEAY